MLDSAPMQLKRLLQTVLPLLLGMSLAVPRADGAHLHLCLDGQEAPVELHSPDGGEHHADESGTEHQDRDLDLSSDSLGKSPSKGFDSGMPATAPSFVAFATSSNMPRPVVDPVPVLSTRRFVLPPFRGPPA